MAWIMDTYSMHMRQTVTAVVTGKPLNIGGSRGRSEATGRGVMVVADEALKRLNMSRENTRVIMQGFGNVGSNAARLMHERIQDHRHRRVGWRSLQPQWHRHRRTLGVSRQRNGTIHGFPGAEPADPRNCSSSDCEMLVPAATENVITSRNADKIKARSSSKALTVQPPQRPTKSLPTSTCSSFPTSSPTPAVSPPRTSSGCRIARATSGRNRSSTSSWITSCVRRSRMWSAYAETHNVNNRIAAYMLAIDRVRHHSSARHIRVGGNEIQ